MFDLTPATAELSRIVTNVRDEQLEAATPCPELTVGALLGHVHHLSVAFRDAAAKIDGPTTGTPPTSTALVLPADWRSSLPVVLDELAAAWRQAPAWAGMTKAGGMDLPGEVAGAIAANEVTLHAWDLAVATGQTVSPDPTALEHSHEFCAATQDDPQARAGLFGPVVPVPSDASLLDRTLGLAGRNPAWSA